MDPTADPANGQTTNPTRLGRDLTTEPTDDPTITVTVADAAKLLGLTTEAVRMRVKRGTLASTKIASSVYVLLDRGEVGPNEEPNARPNVQPNERTNDQPNTEVILRLEDHNSTLHAQVDHLQRELAIRNEELRRKDHLLAAALERIPELEVPRESREAPETATNLHPGADPQGDAVGKEPTKSRSWWQRLFEG